MPNRLTTGCRLPKVTARWKYGIGVGYTISIEEGHFNADGVFVADRRRNGDETYHGAWVEPNNRCGTRSYVRRLILQFINDLVFQEGCSAAALLIFFVNPSFFKTKSFFPKAGFFDINI